jgi:polar amino acid transport system substrate-binding protein
MLHDIVNAQSVELKRIFHCTMDGSLHALGSEENMMCFRQFVQTGILLALSLQCAASTAAPTSLTLTTEDYPPFNVKADNEHPIRGISTDIIRVLMKRAGIEINIKMYPWQRALTLAANDSDTCVYSTVRTAKREETYKWVGPVVSDDWALFAPGDSKIVIKSLDDARKYKLGGYLGDAAGDFLVTHQFNVDLTDTDKLNPKKLMAGRIDLWIAGVRTGPFVARREGVLNIKPVFTFGEAKDYQMYLACNKAVPNATVNKLNDILKEMRSDGSIADIQAKY